MQGNWVDSRLLVVGSQITNLTPDLFFGHNLCFRCPNGSCELILEPKFKIFPMTSELLKPLSFDPYNHPLKIRESTGTPSPKVKVALGM